MTERYTAHYIPKSSGGSRLIHAFTDTDEHRDSLKELRKHYTRNPVMSREGVPISLWRSVHGYPAGCTNMVRLMESFMGKHGDCTKKSTIVTAFDLTNFYHFISKDHLRKSPYGGVAPLCDKAFVDIGNGIEVLSQGSPLSQDISNMCMQEIDLKALALAKSFNAWSLFDGEKREFGIGHDMAYRDRQVYGKGVAHRYLGPQEVDLLMKSLPNTDKIQTMEISYMRYVDNIYLMFSGAEEVSPDILKRVAASFTALVKKKFIEEGFSINNMKNGQYFSETNRKRPILGLNTTERIKCSKYYLNRIRAGLFNFSKDESATDISQSLASSAIFALYVDPQSYKRFKKSLDVIAKMDLRRAHNAASLLKFSAKENSRTGDIPIFA
jgi:hypothetical protein